jgi:hypothetical protein
MRDRVKGDGLRDEGVDGDASAQKVILRQCLLSSRSRCPPGLPKNDKCRGKIEAAIDFVVIDYSFHAVYTVFEPHV